MTFPVIQGTKSGFISGATVLTATWTGTIVAGEQLLVYITGDRAAPATPAGWTLLRSATGAVANGFNVYRKIAAGGDTFSFTYAASTDALWITYRISAVDTAVAVVMGTDTTGTSTTPNPPSLTSGFGATDTLWIASAVNNFDETPTYPASYSLGQIEIHSVPNQALALAARQLNAATEDPGTFTFPSGAAWLAETAAVKGAPANAGNMLLMF